MKRLLFLIFAIIIVNTCFTQRIYFCKNYTTNGEPISTGNTWTISSGAGNVYVLYQNGGRLLNVSSITYYIDKLSSSTGTYSAWENKYPSTDPNKTWHVLDYKFTTTGEYKIRVLINSVEVAAEYVTIKDNGSSTNPTSTTYKDEYINSSISAGTDVDLSTGYVNGLSTYFYMNAQNSAKVSFKVSNGPNKLNTTSFIVDIYKMNTSGTYDFYVTEKYNISDLNWVVFNYTFYTAGSYKLSVYTGTSAYINTSYITIYAYNSNTPNNNSNTTTDYSGSSVSAGTDIDLSTGYVYGLGGPFNRSSSTHKVKVHFKVNNGTKSVNTPKLIVDIYKMNSSSTYEFHKTNYYDLKNSSLSWVVFNHEFELAGTYKISVYNGNSVWVNTAYITVN